MDIDKYICKESCNKCNSFYFRIETPGPSGSPELVTESTELATSEPPELQSPHEELEKSTVIRISLLKPGPSRKTLLLKERALEKEKQQQENAAERKRKQRKRERDEDEEKCKRKMLEERKTQKKGKMSDIS